MKDKVALAGAVVTAVTASLGCLGPLLAVLLGLGTFSAATTFETWRPYLLGLTVLLLVGAFYLNSRNHEVESEASGGQVRGANRSGKVRLWLATVVVMAFATFPYYSGVLPLARTQTRASSTKTAVSSEVANSKEVMAVVSISGMVCDACAAKVRNALAEVPGVKLANVSYAKGEAVVSYRREATNPDAIRSAIDATGFKVGEVTLGTPKPSQAGLDMAVIGVEGMHWGACAATIQLALGKVKGVSSVKVSLERKEVRAIYDPALVAPERIWETIEKAGYKWTEATFIPMQ